MNKVRCVAIILTLLLSGQSFAQDSKNVVSSENNKNVLQVYSEVNETSDIQGAVIHDGGILNLKGALDGEITVLRGGLLRLETEHNKINGRVTVKSGGDIIIVSKGSVPINNDSSSSTILDALDAFYVKRDNDVKISIEHPNGNKTELNIERNLKN